MDGLADFIFNLFEEVQEEQLWDIWLHQPYKEESFEEWKKKNTEQTKRTQSISEEEEERIVKEATKYITPINDIEGGENE